MIKMNQLLGMILLLGLTSCATTQKPTTTAKTSNKEENTLAKAAKKVTKGEETKKNEETIKQTVSTKQAQKSTAELSWYDKLKKSPFSAAYLNDTYVPVEGAHGFTSVHYFYLHYKIDKYHRLTLKPTIATTHTKGQREQGDFHTQLSSTELRLTRSSILNQTEHGVNYSFMLRNYLVNKDTREASGYDSYHYLYNSLSRNFGRYTLSVAPYLLIFNDNGKTNGASNPASHVWTMSATNSYTFTDSISASVAMAYYSYIYDNSDRNFERLYGNLTLNYNFKNGISLSAYYEAYPIVSAKGNMFDTYQGDWLRTGMVGTNLYIPVF